jgi:hypothetical protein
MEAFSADMPDFYVAYPEVSSSQFAGFKADPLKKKSFATFPATTQG